MQKVTLLLIIAIAATAFAIATAPAFAMRDMKASSAATAAAEGAATAGVAAAAGATSGGTVKSLVTRSGKKITGLGAIQALAYTLHKSRTLWLIAAAKIVSAISVLLLNEMVPIYSQSDYYYTANTLAVVLWIGAIGSAVSAVILLTSRAQDGRAEFARVSKSLIVGFLVFLILAGLAIYYISMNLL